MNTRRFSLIKRAPVIFLIAANLLILAASIPTNHSVKYAFQNSAGWHLETVGPGSTGSYISLALDGAGYAHISYYANNGSSGTYLKYAYQDVAGWHIQTVACAGQVSEYSSLALNADGNPYISYYHRNNGDLMIAAYAVLLDVYLPLVARNPSR